MPNTFTTNYSLEKSEIGGDNSQWGSRIHTAFDTTDAQLINKLDKDNVKGFTSTAIVFTNTGASTGTITAASGDLFEDFEVNDKIKVSGATSATNGSTAAPAEHTITAKTNSNSITVSTGLVDASAGDSVTITLITEIGRVDINSGTIDGATIATSDITVGSGKTLNGSGTFDVSSGTLTTTTAQKDAIVDGSTAITRSSNDLTFAGNVNVTGDVTVTGGDIKSSGGTTAISVSSANTTLAGTANNIGTVTAGTINDTVSIVGTPRNTTIKKYSDANDIRSTTTTEKAFTDSISFACKSGKTYVFSATGTAQLSETSFTTSTDTEGYIYLKHHSSSVSQDASSPSGTLMNACTLKISPPDGMIQLPFHILGVFECTTNATKHFYVSYKSKNAQSYMTMVEGRNSSGVIIMLQEYDTDNYTVT